MNAESQEGLDGISVNFLILLFVLLAVSCRETDRKYGKDMTCNKGPQQEPNWAHCGYVACTLTIELPEP